MPPYAAELSTSVTRAGVPLAAMAFLHFFDERPLHRPIDGLGRVDDAGRPEGGQVAGAPHRLVLRAPEAIRDAGADWGWEFHHALVDLTLPNGTDLYEVYACESDAGEPGEEVQIGTIRLDSSFVSSAFGDRGLHFFHAPNTKVDPPVGHCQVEGGVTD